MLSLLASKWIIWISILLCIFAVLAIFGPNEQSIFYRLASKILGQEPTDGDGAFQFPIGWVFMVIFGALLGAAIGVLLRKLGLD